MLELATSLIALNHGVIPATLNYSNPDPTCPLNIVTGAPKATNNKIVININVTGQAQAAAAVVSAA
jgi:3-oxoacyl-[acyl-carrier-protein] synthase II